MTNEKFSDVNYFTLDELLRSSMAKTRAYIEQYEPSETTIDNLHCLCVNVLDPARETLGMPIKITSGYRCARVNADVGGSETSHHTRGMAADVKCDDLEALFEIFRAGKFTQLIRYYEDENPENPLNFLHVSYDPKNLKCEIKERLIQSKGQRRYRNWKEGAENENEN